MLFEREVSGCEQVHLLSSCMDLGIRRQIDMAFLVVRDDPTISRCGPWNSTTDMEGLLFYDRSGFLVVNVIIGYYTKLHV